MMRGSVQMASVTRFTPTSAPLGNGSARAWGPAITGKQKAQGRSQWRGELVFLTLGLGNSRYSTSRHPQNAICRVSVVTHTMMERQKRHPGDLGSRLIVHRGIEMASELSIGASITSPIGRTRGNLKPGARPPLVPGMRTMVYV